MTRAGVEPMRSTIDANETGSSHKPLPVLPVERKVYFFFRGFASFLANFSGDFSNAFLHGAPQKKTF